MIPTAYPACGKAQAVIRKVTARYWRVWEHTRHLSRTNRRRLRRIPTRDLRSAQAQLRGACPPEHSSA
jgi:hypothetical protein